MVDSFVKGYVKRGSNYPLHPNLFILRPDKICSLSVGLNTSPEGWWDCSGYPLEGFDKIGHEWMSIGWDVSTNSQKLYLWIRFLTASAPKLNLDGIWIELVDHTPQNSMGYGPEHFSKKLDSVDDLFDFISKHKILKDFFFSAQEIKQLKLNHYVKR